MAENIKIYICDTCGKGNDVSAAFACENITVLSGEEKEALSAADFLVLVADDARALEEREVSQKWNYFFDEIRWKRKESGEVIIIDCSDVSFSPSRLSYGLKKCKRYPISKIGDVVSYMLGKGKPEPPAPPKPVSQTIKPERETSGCKHDHVFSDKDERVNELVEKARKWADEQLSGEKDGERESTLLRREDRDKQAERDRMLCEHEELKREREELKRKTDEQPQPREPIKEDAEQNPFADYLAGKNRTKPAAERDENRAAGRGAADSKNPFADYPDYPKDTPGKKNAKAAPAVITVAAIVFVIFVIFCMAMGMCDAEFVLAVSREPASAFVPTAVTETISNIARLPLLLFGGA